jgi:MFS transporter, ACS family, solute carrier family 17 (sodium-dependent inorganic phosphate cotransporter), member 5
MGAVVYAGAQFGTIISMPLSGLLAEHSWPSIFYVFGAIGVVWSLAFLWTVHEDPQSSPKISLQEKEFINTALWGTGATDKSPAIPWKSIATSMPFYAILFAHVSCETESKTKKLILNAKFSVDGSKLRLRVLDD